MNEWGTFQKCCEKRFQVTCFSDIVMCLSTENSAKIEGKKKNNKEFAFPGKQILGEKSVKCFKYAFIYL